MANTKSSKKMNQKKKVPQRGLGVAQLEMIRLEEQHKEDSIFIPTSSRIDFSSKNCVFRPNQSVPFLENYPKLCNDDHHGVVFGHNFPLLQRSSSMVNVSSSNQSYYGYKCLSHWPQQVKISGTKRPYPFSPESVPVPSFQCKLPQFSVSPVSRSRESASSSNECCSVNVEEKNVLKREEVQSEPLISLRKTKILNGDFLKLAPPAATLPQSLQLYDNVPSQVAAAESASPSGVSISVQQPILGFFQSAKVQIDREEIHGSDIHTEIGGNIDLELKL